MLILDFPAHWSAWTRQILSVCDVVIVSGLNTVPGLRQVADALAAVRSVQPLPPRIVVGLNRCEPRWFGGIARRKHIDKVLAGETVLTVRDDAGTAIQGINTGVPSAIGSPSSRVSKDVRAFAALLAAVTHAHL
jgi:Flp pilus assembly CpaE family ATPase